jgi:hypothetical protein
MNKEGGDQFCFIKQQTVLKKRSVIMLKINRKNRAAASVFFLNANIGFVPLLALILKRGDPFSAVTVFKKICFEGDLNRKGCDFHLQLDPDIPFIEKGNRHMFSDSFNLQRLLIRIKHTGQYINNAGVINRWHKALLP